MGNYYIGRDETGKAVLMHSDVLMHKKDHKYIKKIGDRYFYTTQELQAFYEKAKEKSPVTITKGEADHYDNTKSKYIDISSKKDPWKYAEIAIQKDKGSSGRRKLKLYTGEHTDDDNDFRTKRYAKGRIKKEVSPEGTVYTMDITKKKHKTTARIADIMDNAKSGAASGSFSGRNAVDEEKRKKKARDSYKNAKKKTSYAVRRATKGFEA